MSSQCFEQSVRVTRLNVLCHSEAVLMCSVLLRLVLRVTPKNLTSSVFKCKYLTFLTVKKKISGKNFHNKTHTAV